MKSLEQLRQYVYSFLDVEEYDIAQDLLTSWATEGYDKIVKVGRRHPHFESSWEFTQTEQSTDLPDDLAAIELVTIDGYQAEPISLMEAQQRWPAGYTGSTSTPVCFTVRGTDFLLWPNVPESGVTVKIFGWRKPLDWATDAAGLPDMPEHLEGALLSFMLYRAYGHQGMLEEAQMERAEFDSQLREMMTFDNEASPAAPLVLGGTQKGIWRSSPYSGVGPLIFDPRRNL